MAFHRRTFLHLAAGAAVLPAAPRLAWSQAYPTRPVTLVAPWPAGGAVDILCRTIAPPLGAGLGQTVVVEDRPGAGSVLGTASVARAAPDGYTLVMAGSAALAVAVAVYKKLPYDPRRDLAPVGLVARIPFILVVNPSLPVHDVGELIALAKQKPGALSYASGGPGSPHHLYMELFKTMTGTQMLHVPYKGTAPALTDVIANQVPVMFADVVGALPMVRAGKVRALAVSSIVRFPEAPEIPTVAEQGVRDFDGVGWVSAAAPAGTPAPILDRLHAALKAAIALPATQKQIALLGMIPIDSPPLAEIPPFLDREIVRWSGVVEQAGIAGTQ
jgi:tripartite-type tricarboxylate transporter receptor subunit TctC